MLSAWKELHQTPETLLANIKERNPHILDKRERRRRAEAHLKMFELKPHDGSLEGIDDDNERNHQLDYIDNVHELSGAFDDYVHWEQTHQMRHEKMRVGSNQKFALCHLKFSYNEKRGSPIPKTSPSGHPSSSVISGTSTPKKKLDLNDRKNKKTRSRWKSFMDIVGDEVLTNQTINDGLRAWVNAQRGPQC